MKEHCKETLNRLKALTEGLCDRDAQLKSDVQLFEEFFEFFPIPVTIWSIGQSRVVLSQRGNGFVRQDATTLDELFLCSESSVLSIAKHEEAFSGKKIDYFVKTTNALFFVKLLPSYDEDHSICGVTGISWDVSDNMTILSCLESIFEQTAGRRGEYKDIHRKSAEALAASRLKRLLDEIGG